MTTVTSTVATPTELSKISTYLKTHEKLIIILLFLLTGIHFYSKIINAWAAHEQRVDIAGNAAAQTAVQVAQAQALTNAKEAADYAALAAQLAASNKALTAGQATRNAATQTQQTVDKTLAPSDLGNRWAALLHLAPGKVVYKASGAAVDSNIDAFLVAPDAAIVTTVALESIPSLEANLADETTITANLQQQLTSLGTVNGGLNKQIADQAVAFTAQAKACTDDKNLLKAKARKSKFHWFVGGVITGFVAREVIKAVTGF